ncbi:MAG: formylglycine-generating enzyme family protein, partial [Planctomycetia bacterium]
PVERVSLLDAREFCRMLGESDGGSYRLPTEIEWETAARGGATTDWYFGDDGHLEDHAWTARNSDYQTQNGGGLLANAYGLFDVYGNVAEWCDGPFLDYRTESPFKRFVGQSPVRGGSWADRDRECTSAARRSLDPAARKTTVGFRIVSDRPPPSGG